MSEGAFDSGISADQLDYVQIDDGLIDLDNRSNVHVSFVSNWRLLGQANLGYVVGVGCKDDLNPDSDVPLYRLYFIAIID